MKDEDATDGTVTDGLMTIDCPRCRRKADVNFYGPCDECRAELRALLRSEASAVVAREYEPKMNVTPNAVALKD